jgi:hypothetical protein
MSILRCPLLSRLLWWAEESRCCLASEIRASRRGAYKLELLPLLAVYEADVISDDGSHCEVDAGALWRP